MTPRGSTAATGLELTALHASTAQATVGVVCRAGPSGSRPSG